MLRLCVCLLGLSLVATGAFADAMEDCTKASGDARIAACTQVIEKSRQRQ